MTTGGDSAGNFELTFDLLGDGLAGQPAPAASPANEVLEKNLRALADFSPGAAERIRAASPSRDVEFVDSDEADPGVVLCEHASVVADPFALLDAPAEATTRVLASRRRPITEGRALADTIDLAETGGVCVFGFGAGYHCRALGERLGKNGVVLCFEPDVGMLRAVLERVDHSDWIRKTSFVLLTDPDDASAITAAIQGLEGVLALGVKVVEHPASRHRLAGVSKRFGESFGKAMRVLRTGVMTTLVRAQASLLNVLMNADHYAASPGLGDLAGVCAGRPGIVVSAGPSLERNLHLLADPAVRERAVIIAAQTMLKPLLRRGIKPHFVCALDYHELSRRFYEGLTAEDVEGVTLVVEPKANPAILDAFPGAIRCVLDDLLERTLGPELAGSKSPLKPGATVAHLCAYLARHLGCDPLVLIGQDLGFTDGQYYAAGAAIHDVWAGELGPMRSLEMFEWERITRMKGQLRKATDVLDRPIYTDDQMAAYLSQFEIDFAEDTRNGKRVVDATEGGVRKRHTSVATLAETLETCAGAEPLPALSTEKPSGGEREKKAAAVAARLDEVAAQADHVEALSRKAAGILKKMLAPGASPAKIDRLISDVYKVRDEVRVLEPAYGLVQHLNQTGALRRFKADRDINLEELDERARQRRQIERDAENVSWTADAAAELAGQLRDSAAAVRGERSKATTDPVPAMDGPEAPARTRVGALLFIDPQINGLGLARDEAAAEAVLGEPALRATVRRLLRTTGLDGIAVCTSDTAWAAERLGELADDARVRVEPVDGERLRARTRAVGRARLVSPDAWRGALGGLSCYDESFDPVLAEGAVEKLGCDAAVIVGADWAAVDPGLVDAVIDRYRERPDAVRIAMCQAAPGLAGLLLAREALADLSAGAGHAANYASIGGVLSYLPVAPQADPIAKAFCVSIPHTVRDAGRRLIPDTPEGLRLLGTAAERVGPGWAELDAAALVAALPSDLPTDGRSGVPPRHLELELCVGRLAGGPWAVWQRGGAEECERPVLETADAVRIIEGFARGRPDTLLTLHGVGDPLMHAGVLDVIRAAKAAGVGSVHLRTDALADGFDPAALAGAGLDVLSVDVLAASPEAYRGLMGVDRYEDVKGRVEAALTERGTAAGLPVMWVVPRMTRCDEVYTEVERFYDGWLMACCAAVIDPIPSGAVLPSTARIRPFPLPMLAAERVARETIVVRSDGTALAAGVPRDPSERRRGERVLGNVLDEPFERVWAGRRALAPAAA